RLGPAAKPPPKIFHVNWFRQNAEGQFIWPGYGENMRVLRWIVGRCAERAQAKESPIGLLPAQGAIDIEGLSVDTNTMHELLSVSAEAWRRDPEDSGKFFEKFGNRLPDEMNHQRKALVQRLR